MATPIENARSAATVILIRAVRIVQTYSDYERWNHPKRGLTIPALEFGDFLRDVIDAERTVNAVANELIDAKRDDRIVKFGSHFERTGHQVAIKFARQVGATIWQSLWIPDKDGVPTGTALEPWPIDGLMTGRHHSEFCHRWKDIRVSLSRISVTGTNELLPLILLESRRVIQKQLSRNPSDDDDAPDIRHSEDFRSVWWFGESFEFTGNQALVVKKLWEAWLNKTPVLSAATLNDALDSESRMSVVFRGHPAFGTMIVKSGKDSYRLEQPQNSENLEIRP